MKLRSLFRQNRNEWSDQELLLAFLEKEKEVYFDVLFERYHPLVYAICLNYTADREESKDLTLDVFLAAFKQIKKQKINQFDHWISVLAKNTCLAYLKKCRKQREKQEEWWSVKKSDQFFIENVAFRRLIYEEDLAKDRYFQISLSRLSARQRLCIDLFFFKSYSYQRIADENEITIKEVKSHIQNGKRKLKVEMIKLESQRKNHE